MSERPKADPDCFVSDKLRVEIGGEQFAFPRKMVHSMQGEDVVNVRGEKYRGSASGQKACQKNEDGFWVLEYAALKFNLKSCSRKQDCNLKEIGITMHAKNAELDGTFRKQMTKEQLLNSCKPDPKAESEWRKKYWRICRYSFFDSGHYFSILFRGGGGIYPPEDIENTKRLILEEIYKYKIKSTKEEN